MSENKYFTRYAHSEGITSLCYDDDGVSMLTCGSDGDVRIWKDMEDDDPKSHRVGEAAYAIAFKKGCFYVSTDTNSVLAYDFPDGAPDGIVARFSALVNHLSISSDGTNILAGSSDFSLKLVDIGTKRFKSLLGHDAPILSVALDPSMEYAASSSCDGTVRIWKLARQTFIKAWASVFPSSNEFSASKVLCRMAWQPLSGKLLAVPFGNTVKLFHRDSWEEACELKDSSVTEAVNVVAFSACGQYLAVGCIDGLIATWNVNLARYLAGHKPDKGFAICSIEWNPNGNGALIFCDIQGRLGSVEGVALRRSSDVSNSVKAALLEADGDVLDTLDHLEDDDDDENTFSIAKLKAETVGLEDFSNADSKPDWNSLSTCETHTAAHAPYDTVVPQGLKLAEPQEAFQPGSTPVFYSHRFMVWNSVGIIYSYNTEEENTIDIEFHDTSVHHSLHLENAFGHTMADLSSTAVLLSSVSQQDCPSKLVCMHFASWDNTKEWTLDMPEDENVQAVAVAESWVAVATDARHLRLFTIGGVQRQVLSMPGPVVAMSARNGNLVVAFHHSLGLHGDQCLGAMLVDICDGRAVAEIYNLPLSAKATLAWIGFTDEETPCSVDSHGAVRVLAKSSGQAWIEIANTKAHAKNKSHSYFVVGASETQQVVRCILCKGSKYPATLPRPTVTVVPFRLPLCEMATEKGQLEESIMRQSLLLDMLSHLDTLGYEQDGQTTERAKLRQKESLIKLFALACHSGREFRSVEVCHLMDTSQTVQLAIKYATQVKCLQLADRLGEIAYDKMERETERAAVPQSAVPASVAGVHGYMQQSNRREAEPAEDDEETVDHEPDNDSEETESVLSMASNAACTSDTPQTERKNPFRVSSTPNTSEIASHSRGIQRFDSMKNKSVEKTCASKSNMPKEVLQRKTTNIKEPRQTQLFSKMEPNIEGKEKASNGMPACGDSKNSPQVQHKTGIQLWIEANTEHLKAENQGLDDSQMALAGVKEFKKLPAEEREVWIKKAEKSRENDTGEHGKRKRETETNAVHSKQPRGDQQPDQNTAKSQSSTSSKLKSFTFRK